MNDKILKSNISNLMLTSIAAKVHALYMDVCYGDTCPCALSQPELI